MQFHNLVLTDDACLLYGLSSEVKLREVGLDSLPPVDTTQPSLERAARHAQYLHGVRNFLLLAFSITTNARRTKREGPSDNRAARCRNPDRPAVHEHGSLTRLVCTEWCNIESTFVVVPFESLPMH